MEKRKIGIAYVDGKEIELSRNQAVTNAVRKIAQFGLITFSRTIQFKSTEYFICFFKSTDEMRSMYNLGNELLIVCCPDGMNDFKSRTKDFIDYMLVTNNEFKNRLDKMTCFLIDGDDDVVNIVKADRIENPDSRLIVPFNFDELNGVFDETMLRNRMREFLYERDLFGIAVPLRNDALFFGKDRTNIISELYARYTQGEEGGLFGLRRIGKTSILNLLKLRVLQNDGIAIYFDCSSCHHFRWNEMLKYVINKLTDEYIRENPNGFNEFSDYNSEWGTEKRYNEKNAAQSFSDDIKEIYKVLGEKRILLILDEIECISYSTSPAEWWSKDTDALYFWQTIRSLIQMHSECLSFVIAGVNPMCIETPQIMKYDNPIFGMIRPIYTSLFGYEDIKNMVSSIGGRLGLSFEEAVYVKMMEDYGGHPFLIRQVCSQINNELNMQKVERPTIVTRYSYLLKYDEYRQGMTSIIEQILWVIKNYYPNEFELLKRLALDGRNAFKKEIALGDKGIQHLIGYCIIEKSEGEYFIRIKSIEEYIKNEFQYDTMLNDPKDIRLRINMRRDDIEEKLRGIVLSSIQLRYGRKAKEHLIILADKTSNDQKQKGKMINADGLKRAAEELYLSQIKLIIDKEWKHYEKVFVDKSKFDTYMEILNRSRNVGAHTRSISQDDEVMYRVAFEFFENALMDY